jgi:hypothetical protein
MTGQWTILLGAVIAVLFVVTSDAAVITMSSGETIVCTVVKEEPTYLVVDHDGYERNVVKSQIRSIDRDAVSLTSVTRESSIELTGGGTFGIGSADAGLWSADLMYHREVTENLAVTAGLHIGRSRTTSEPDPFSMLPGTLDWNAVSLGIAFVLPSIAFDIQPTIGMGGGYYQLGHKVDVAEVVKLQDFFLGLGDTLVAYREPVNNSYGVWLRSGFLIPMPRGVSLSISGSYAVIPTAFFRSRTYEGFDHPAQDRHSLFVKIVQFNIGVRIPL